MDNYQRMNKKKIINDPVYGFITIPGELIFDIVSHPYFQRLRHIKQLGLTDYITRPPCTLDFSMRLVLCILWAKRWIRFA